MRIHTVCTIHTIITSDAVAGVPVYKIGTRATVLTWIIGAVVHIYNKGSDII